MTPPRSTPRLATALALCLVALAPALAFAQQPVRVATYNIKFFNTAVPAARLANLKTVVAALDADIIGLEEIADRAALEALFDKTAWDIVIDDDSGEVQDVALAVRRPLRVLGMSADLDADDEHFLFPGPANESPFPDRRDLLCIQVSIPGEADPLFVMVHHAKSRLGGRATTDPRREAAALALLGTLEQQFDGKRFVIVGDMNDNPDDRSMNILEAGSPSAAGGPEEIDGPFLANLCEPLVVQDRVSWGLHASDISGGLLNTAKAGSRAKNNAERGAAGSVSPILFDQILIPMSMKNLYVDGSAKVFDNPAAMTGGADAPSDHVPVFADFVFAGGGGGATPTPTPSAGLVIAEVLPDPAGDDRGHEEVVLKNGGTAAVPLAGWRLRDRAGNTFTLAGSAGAGAKVTITLPSGQLPLNNDGDDVSLLDPSGTIVNQRTYTASQVGPGTRIAFP